MSASEKQRAHLAKVAKLLKGSKRSAESRALMSQTARVNAQINWQGGAVGEAFAAVLCPAGYVREYYLYYGDPVVKLGSNGTLRRRFFRLDFAHLEAMCNVELDGPGHKFNKSEDEARDKILREMGWKVVRIKHKEKV